MKSKILFIFIITAGVISFPAIAGAQYMTQDIVFLKLGYIPDYTVSFDSKDGYEPDKINAMGFAAQGEYNLNLSGFWLGFGVEYQYIRDDSGRKDINHSFILPMASIKFSAAGGLYLGVGASGKYLLATGSIDGVEAKKYIDLWVNGIIGYHFPVSEGVFLDIEGRFGWNLTNKQFSEFDSPLGTRDADPDYAWDAAIYAGVGFRAFGTN